MWGKRMEVRHNLPVAYHARICLQTADHKGNRKRGRGPSPSPSPTPMETSITVRFYGKAMVRSAFKYHTAISPGKRADAS
jgi:hypothetical protein